MNKLVTVYGGSGFIGRYIVRRLAKEGWRVRVAVRRPNEALFVKTYGSVGQVEPVLCNIRDDRSVFNAAIGASALINCVGILAEVGNNTFEEVQFKAADRVARTAAEFGITKLVQLSAIGANSTSKSKYARTKFSGETAIFTHVPKAVVLRPSIVFGPEDQFFNRFAAMTKISHLLPIVGANTRFQPVYVDDVAKAAVFAMHGRVPSGIYELGGPETKTFRELMEKMFEVIRQQRIIVNVPFPIASAMGLFFNALNTISIGLIPAQITRDQVNNLAYDNIVSHNAKGFTYFDIKPVAMDAVLSEYLWRFRPSGQYEEMKESAKNMRL
ncbi:MAG: complex I NDUFA9 subunit family protein [Aestuariivita sp.]|nr:complex I NDUFA9 subunit family protein [Aestuariivita sp.]